MNTGPGNKTCKMCCMEIPQDARKCPYCLHFQNKFSLVVLHPLFAGLLACVPLILIAVVFNNIFDRGEDYEEYKNQIVITESQAVFGENKGSGTVGVVGMIRNNSAVPWQDIRFHVEFFDADGKRVDVAQKEQYAFYLPPNEALSFKVSFGREYPQTNYVKHSVRVAMAKDARARW